MANKVINVFFSRLRCPDFDPGARWSENAILIAGETTADYAYALRKGI